MCGNQAKTILADKLILRCRW